MRENKTRNDGMKKTTERRTSDRFFSPPLSSSFLGGGLAALTEKLIKSRRGVSDAANCGTVRCCGPTPKPGPFITCPPEGGRLDVLYDVPATHDKM